MDSSSLFAQSALPSFALGEKKILYIRISYPDDLSDPITAADAATLMTQVNTFYRAQSYAQFGAASIITPLLQFPRAKDSYFPKDENGNLTVSHYELLNDARDAALKAGYNYADYDIDILRFNSPTWQSFANVGARGAWMVSSDVPTTIHEIGHNLGLRHANKWTGPLNGPGWNDEYGDEFDIMGNPFFYRQAGFHAIHKIALGWFGHSDISRLAISGVYRIYAHDVAQLQPHRRYLLRLRKDSDRDYWIEKRQLIDTDEYVENGVLVHWNAWSESNRGTQLLDAIDGPGEALRIGTPLVDATAGVRIFPLRQAEDRSFIDIAVFLGFARLNIVPGLLHFSGTPGRSYRVQTSSDLCTWSELTNTSAPTGELFLPIQTGKPKTFYRVVDETPDRT